MRADLLHVVCAISNPIRWLSRIDLARDFANHMLASGVHLTIVECTYGDRPSEIAGIDGVNHIVVSGRSMVWNKENLINVGISRLPPDWKYVAWIDADIRFRRPNWAADTVHALQLYDVIQPWETCYDLGPNDEHLEMHRSFCSISRQRKPIMPGGGPYAFAHPGYAWAATRQALEFTGGLVDTAALGAADHHMALALIGRAPESCPYGISPGYMAPIMNWQARAAHHIARNIGYLPGTIEHYWHGPKKARNYVSRWDVLVRHKFDPHTDLKRNVWGIYELAGNKPALRDDIDTYFRQRNEDQNSNS